MTVRKTQLTDLETVRQIYAYARVQMRQGGNPSQWGDNRPSDTAILADIRNSQSFVIEENENICGIFAFIIGEDPTYQILEHSR